MKNLMDYLPECYGLSQEVRSFQEAWQPEIDLIWQIREDLLAQLDPNTATWGLALWEDSLGLSSDKAVSYFLRRNRVVARLRGLGTTTPKRLQTVLETFCPGCDVAITEHFHQYLIEIKLNMTDCGVEDLPGLKNMLRLIMPAHLAWGFAIRLESGGGIRYGGACECLARVEIWPGAARKVETAGWVYLGTGTEVMGSAAVWPAAARKIDAAGVRVPYVAAAVQPMIEIYPLQGGN